MTQIADAIIAGIASEDTALEQMSAIVGNLERSGYVIVPAKGASGRFTNRDELIRLIDKASGGYNPCRNAVADAILAVLTPAEGEPPNARNRIEARDKLIETLEAENTRLVVLVEKLTASRDQYRGDLDGMARHANLLSEKYRGALEHAREKIEFIVGAEDCGDNALLTEIDAALSLSSTVLAPGGTDGAA